MDGGANSATDGGPGGNTDVTTLTDTAQGESGAGAGGGGYQGGKVATISEHVHTGEPGLTYPNGCYTKATTVYENQYCGTFQDDETLECGCAFSKCDNCGDRSQYVSCGAEGHGDGDTTGSPGREHWPPQELTVYELGCDSTAQTHTSSYGGSNHINLNFWGETEISVDQSGFNNGTGYATLTLVEIIKVPIIITADTESTTSASSITYTFTFREEVTGFDASDITVTNGTKGTFSGSGRIYTLVVTNSGSCTQTIKVNADVSATASGNGNEATSKTIVIDRELTKNSSIATYSYTGSVQTFTAPFTGKYVVEAWGAQGGSVYDNNVWVTDGGKGGYTQAVVSLTKGQILYIYVGGRGADADVYNSAGGTPAGGYNGGAVGNQGQGSVDGSITVGGGGGATHIALTERGELVNYNEYRTERLITAGGGVRYLQYNSGTNSMDIYDYAGGEGNPLT